MSVNNPVATASYTAASNGGKPFESIRLLDIELSEPLPEIDAKDGRETGEYKHARALVRLHTRPLGVIDIRFQNSCIKPHYLAGQIWLHLRRQINRHLVEDQLFEADHLTGDGLQPSEIPPCVKCREDFLARAPFVSVAIATRDRPDTIVPTVQSLLEMTYPSFEIIVVDNAPRTSATQNAIDEHFGKNDRVRYVRENRPGLSWARNCGLWNARGEIVAYTDDDILADHNWLGELAMGFEAAEDVACVTGMTLPAELESPAQVWFEQFGGTNKGRGFERLVFNMTTHRLDHPLYPYLTTNFGTGANTAYRTAIMRSFGGFDPSLGSGTLAPAGEDLETYFQIISRGHTLVSEPGAILRHLHRGDYASFAGQMRNYGIGFTAYLMKIILDDPRHFYRMALKAPQAASYLFSPKSDRNIKKQEDFPRELTLTELKGMAYGPLAYIRSRRSTHRIISRFAGRQAGAQE